MKKTLLKLAVVAVILLNCCLLPFVGTVQASELSAKDETEMTIRFFSDNQTDSNGNLIPDSSGKITVGVSIVKKSDGVTFTLKTRDKSAISTENDYEESQWKDVHLVTTEKQGATQYFSVQTYQRDAANLIKEGAPDSYGLTRVFEIVICDIKTDSGCKYNVVNDWNGASKKTSFDCRVQTRYDYIFSTKSSEDGCYFVDYLNGNTFTSVWIDRGNVYYQTPSKWTAITVDEDSTFSKTFRSFISADYLAKYRKTGWADVYYGGSANIYESGWCTVDTPAKLTLAGFDDDEFEAQTIFYSEYYDPKSSGAPILFGETKYASNNNSDYRYKLTNNAKSWLANNKGYSIINTDDPMYKHAYCYYTQKDYNFPTAGKVYKNNSDYLTLTIKRDSSWDMVFQFLRLDSELYDTQSPQIANMYFNEITSTDNKVMRISFKFTEPVHFPIDFNQNDLYVTGYANNNANLPLKFTYSGGEGTDTLYFDCDLASYDYNTTITKIDFRSYDALSSAFKNISDYACNFNGSNNYVDLSTFTTVSYSTNIDLRTPSVEAKLAKGDSANAAQSHTVNVSVSNMVSEGSKLYYTWVKAEDVGLDPSSYNPVNYDNCDTINPTNVTVIGQQLNGDYYLYYKALSAYGKETKGYFATKLSFDNTAAKIIDYSFGNSNAAVSERTLNLTFEGDVVDDLTQVQIVYRELGQTAENNILVYDKTATKSSMSAPTYDSSKKTTTASVKLTGDMLGMTTEQSKKFYFSFITYDKAANQDIYETSTAYLFDTFDRLKVNLNITGEQYNVGENIQLDGNFTTVNGQTEYFNSYKKDNFALTFNLSDGSTSAVSIASLYKGSQNVTANVSNYFSCTSGSGSLQMNYIAEQGGFYSIQISSEDKTSDVFSFYIVGSEDQVAGYNQLSSDRLVANKLFNVSDVSYYWLSNNSTVTTENYSSTKQTLVFSSKECASSYFRFMEMQDLSLLYLDPSTTATNSIVENLNNNGANLNYRKASSETKTAVAGQTWIRYKDAGWNQSNDSSAWKYYFYSSAQETEINISKLQTNLVSAINSVVQNIVSKGSYFYLTSDSGIDSKGIPQIDKSRIYPQTSIAQTKNGTSFVTALSYAGDSEIYAPYHVDSQGNSYSIATQKLTVSSYTQFYFRSHQNGSGDYQKLNVNGSFYLKDAINGTGLHDIIELDENGAREYTVYIDNSAPTLKITYNNGTNQQNKNETFSSNYGNGQTLNANYFSFDSLEDDDQYAYVAVFSTGKVLKQTYLLSELSGVSLSTGKYIIEVYDRSGNSYSFSVRVSTDSVKDYCSFTNEKNKNVTFICKYNTDDIYRFEIYLDNVLQTGYSKDKLDANGKIKLTEGGEYRFYVEDIFGNSYEGTTTLVREIPQVTWYYEQNNQFVKYDQNDTAQLGMSITKLGSTSYLVTSCGKVKFTYQSGSDYQVEVLAGNFKNGTGYTGTTTYEATDLDNWQVKVSYTDYPDVFVIFTGKFDVSAPTISATTTRTKYSYADENDEILDSYIQNIDRSTVNVGDKINFTDISFKSDSSVKEAISSGEVVSGSLVCINVSDLSGVSKWSYTYDGKTTEYKEGNLPENVYFSKVGKYVVTATDKLGNTSNFSFEIGKTSYTTLTDSTYFLDLDGANVNYGNDKVVATLEGAGAFVFVLDGKYYKLKTDGENLILCSTVIAQIPADSKSPIVLEEVEETLYQKGNLPTSAKVIEQVSSSSCDVKVYSKNEKIYLEFCLNKQGDNTASIKIRVQSDECVDSRYAQVELSTKLSYVNYEFDGQTGSLNETLYVNKDCTLNLNDEIKSFLVWYSKTDDFTFCDPELISGESKIDTMHQYVCKQNGFYKIDAFNLYGNYSSTMVLYSNGMTVIGSVEYTDGEKVSYSANYQGDLYSNYSVSFTVYTGVKCTVQKQDDENYRASVVQDQDKYIIKLDGNGDYIVTLTDKFGNTVTKKAHIQAKPLAYSDEWLTGFNSKALKKDEGYTNTMVSFSDNLKDVVKYVAYTYNGKLTKVYDCLTESPMQFNSDIVIGQDGEGEYEIVFRDLYGNKATKSVKYKTSVPLIVSRINRSMEKQTFVLTEETLLDGIWSNKSISFECSSEFYKFTVNNEVRDIPFTIEFPTDSERGKFVYTISYVDEYGFAYDFQCILYRANVEVQTNNMVVESGITKDAVSVTFDAQYTAQISINGEVLGEYKSGDKYLQDGNYVISVWDKAGNVERYAVKRDSVVDFCLYTTTKDQPMASGEVTNESSVKFAPLNGDVVSYYVVYHDGVKVDDYDSTTFGESGKWELLLKDEIGNKDYFCFYIVTHSLISFDYTTPSGYVITEATYDGGGGKIDCIESATNENTSFAFAETGEYDIVMTSTLTGKTASFTINIDKTVPKIVLDGVEAGQSTKKNVKITGCKTGDTLYIYKNGKLNKTVKVTTQSDIPEITEKGNYKIVVVNEAGGSTEIEFTRVYTANVATSSLIIVVIVAIVIGLFAGLLFRKRSRIE